VLFITERGAVCVLMSRMDVYLVDGGEPAASDFSLVKGRIFAILDSAPVCSFAKRVNHVFPLLFHYVYGGLWSYISQIYLSDLSRRVAARI
jgi:hypothetical protein